MSLHRFPQRFPIFPLPNVVLFPDVRLPLHTFEPRYRAMTRAALDGNRVIGMVLLRPGADARRRDAPIFEVGCAGEITDCRQLPDGRFWFILRGERRFRVTGEEPSDEGYRIARVALLEDPPFDALAEPLRRPIVEQRARVEELLFEYTRATSPGSVEQLEERIASLDSVELVHALAFGLDHDPLEKQGLLEAPDPLQRCQLLIQLLEFRRAELRLPEPAKNVN